MAKSFNYSVFLKWRLPGNDTIGGTAQLLFIADLACRNHWSMDRHMASTGWFWCRTWSDPRRRHQRVAVRLPMVARRSPCLP